MFLSWLPYLLQCPHKPYFLYSIIILNIINRHQSKLGSRPKLFDEFCKWIILVAENTTLHGIGWYPKFQNRLFKSIILIFSVLVIVGLPWILIDQLIKYQNDKTVISRYILPNVEWITQRVMLQNLIFGSSLFHKNNCNIWK